MLPLQTRIKIYIILSIILHIIYLIAYYVMFVIFNNMDKDGILTSYILGFFSLRFFYFVLVSTLIVIILGVTVYFFSYKKGINRYKELQKRMEDFLIQEDFNLKALDFPLEDEFGNIGMAFNKIINKIEKYNTLRLQRLYVEFEKTRLLADMIDTPILFVGVEDGEKVVRHYNKSFEKIFARKNEKEFYDLRNMLLDSLVVEREGIEFKGVLDTFNKMQDTDMVVNFIDDEFENAIELAITQKTKIDIKKELKTIKGDKKYRCDLISIYPVTDKNGNTLDLMIFFDKLKEIK